MLKVILPVVISGIVDRTIPSMDRENLFRDVILLTLLYLGDALLEYLQSNLVSCVQYNFEWKIRKAINRKILLWEYENYDNVPLKDIVSRYKNETEIIGKNIIFLLTGITKNLFLIFCGSIMMFSLSPIIYTTTMLISILYFLNNLYFGKKIKKITLSNLKNYAEMLGSITENYRNILLIKGYNAYDYIEDKFENGYSKLYNSEKKLYLTSAQNINIGSMILSVIIISIWLIGGNGVINGLITIGNLVALISFQGMIINPMNSFGKFVNSYEKAKVSIDRVEQILSLSDEKRDGILIDDISSIEFMNVSFSYKNRGQIFRNLNFEIQKGEAAVLFGMSGSGKSTIGKLLVRLYESSEGKILINQRNINDINIVELRKQVIYVTQESLFFHDSIINNIGVNNNVEIDETITGICKKLDIWDEILEMPLGIETMIDSNAGNLSGGQKKRIEVVRALSKQANFYIFDETISCLDERRRRRF